MGTKPSSSTFDALLGNALQSYKSRNFFEALRICQALLETQPKNANVWKIIGFSKRDIGDLEGALGAFKNAKANDPTDSWASLYTGAILLALERHQDAINELRDSIALNSTPTALIQLGVALSKTGSDAEALQCFDSAVSLAPDNPDCHNNKGSQLKKMGRLHDSLCAFERACQLREPGWELNLNLGIVLSALGRLEESLSYFQRAAEQQPTLHKAKLFRAVNLLALEKFEEGWKAFDARWAASSDPKDFLQTTRPVWSSTGNSNTLFIWPEGGIGDQIFFSRWLKRAEALSPKLIVAVDNRLTTLFTRSFPKLAIAPKNPTLSEQLYDNHLPLGSIPRALLDLKTSWRPGNDSPYIHPDPALVSKLKHKLSNGGKLVCGITWKSFRADLGREKSLTLNHFATLLQNNNFSFVNLQYGDVDAEIKKLNIDLKRQVFTHTNIDNLNDLESHAALVAACDVLVLACNATAHFAGAMEKKAYLLVPHNDGKIWYWHHEIKGQSAWYPSLTLKHQDSNGDWSTSVQEITNELKIII